MYSPLPKKTEAPEETFLGQKRKQIDIQSWAPKSLLQLERISDIFTAATHRILFPKLSECSISSTYPDQQNSFLSINGKESKTEITKKSLWTKLGGGLGGCFFALVWVLLLWAFFVCFFVVFVCVWFGCVLVFFAFFCRKKSVFEQYPLDTRAADHCIPASSHLADAKWLGLSPVPEWTQLHHSSSSW